MQGLAAPRTSSTHGFHPSTPIKRQSPTALTISKIKGIEYSKLEAQKYLTDKRFSCEERKLLFALRAKCYNAKENFKGMNKHDMKCTLGCNTIENQEHIFTQCSKLK